MAHVQTKHNSDGGSGLTSIVSGAFASSVTIHNAFAWFFAYFNSAGAQTVSLARSTDVFTEVGSIYDASLDMGLRWGYAKDVTAGTGQVTATPGAASSQLGLAILEYSGLDLVTPFGSGESNGQTQFNPGTGADLVTTGNITPAVQPGVMIGLAETVNAYNNLTIGTGFTDRGTLWDYQYSVGNSSRLIEKAISALSATPATWKLGVNDTILSGAMILRNAAAADVIDQAAFRFRNDDGSESAATWAAAQNTNVSLVATSAKRLRMLLNATGDPATSQFKLQSRRVGTGPWRDVF